jgi:hypothetical protein
LKEDEAEPVRLEDEVSSKEDGPELRRKDGTKPKRWSNQLKEVPKPVDIIRTDKQTRTHIKFTNVSSADSIGSVQLMTEGIVLLTNSSYIGEDESTPEFLLLSVDDVWLQSMANEREAVDERGCWRVERIPYGANLIKSEFFCKGFRQLQA